MKTTDASMEMGVGDFAKSLISAYETGRTDSLHQHGVIVDVLGDEADDRLRLAIQAILAAYDNGLEMAKQIAAASSALDESSISTSTEPVDQEEAPPVRGSTTQASLFEEAKAAFAILSSRHVSLDPRFPPWIDKTQCDSHAWEPSGYVLKDRRTGPLLAAQLGVISHSTDRADLSNVQEFLLALAPVLQEKKLWVISLDTYWPKNVSGPDGTVSLATWYILRFARDQDIGEDDRCAMVRSLDGRSLEELTKNVRAVQFYEAAPTSQEAQYR